MKPEIQVMNQDRKRNLPVATLLDGDEQVIATSYKIRYMVSDNQIHYAIDFNAVSSDKPVEQVHINVPKTGMVYPFRIKFTPNESDVTINSGLYESLSCFLDVKSRMLDYKLSMIGVDELDDMPAIGDEYPMYVDGISELMRQLDGTIDHLQSNIDQLETYSYHIHKRLLSDE